MLVAGKDSTVTVCKLYDETIVALLDSQVPRCGRRQSNAWFDDDCRRAKRSLHFVQRDCPTCHCLLFNYGVLNDGVISSCWMRSVLLSGRDALTLNGRSLVACGDRLTSCSDVALPRKPRSTPASFIASLTTTSGSPLFVYCHRWCVGWPSRPSDVNTPSFHSCHCRRHD